MPRIAYEDKRLGRARRELIDKANEIIDEYSATGYSLTLRQLYYQFVSRDLLPNTVKSYKLLGDVISDGRMLGLIDWDAISDRLREVRRQAAWEHPGEILEACANQFKLDPWTSQTKRVEVWVEKDALAEVVTRAAQRLRCPVMVCRGYMSQSAMWEAGHTRFRQQIAEGVEPVVLHLGDHDPSGMDMTRDIEDRLSMFAGGRVTVNRIALNMDQVEEYSPPPNPAKLTDSRAQGYIAEHGDMSWELDALDPKMLDNLITDEIKQHIEAGPWKARMDEEKAHRAKLLKLADNWEKA